MSIQWSYAFSHIKHSWIGLGDHHGYSHDGQDRRAENGADPGAGAGRLGGSCGGCGRP
jgi:hypothetical protein